MAVTTSYSFAPVWGAGSGPLGTPVVWGDALSSVSRFMLELDRLSTGDFFLTLTRSMGSTNWGANYISLDAAGATNGSSFLAGTTSFVTSTAFVLDSAQLVNGDIVSAFWRSDQGLTFQITSPARTGTAPNQTHTIVVDDTDIAPATVDPNDDVSVAALTGGGFVVVWRDTAVADSAIFAKVYNDNGTPLGGSLSSFITVDSASNGVVAAAPRVVGLSGGGFAVTYLETGSPSNSLVFKTYSATGAPVLGRTVLDIFGLNGNMDLVARPNNGFQLVYQDDGWGQPELTSLTVAGDGTPGTFRRLGNDAVRDWTPQLATLSGGQNVVVSLKGADPIDPNQMAFSVLNPDGTVAAAPIVLSMTETAYAADVTAVSANTFAVAWVASNGNGKLNLIELIHNMTGDGANDTAIGFADFRNLIDGVGGDDSLRGGALNDTIFGGLGNDSIDAGLGDDTIDAGDGNDLVIDAGGAVSINGGVGTDTFDASGRTQNGTIHLGVGAAYGGSLVGFENAIGGSGDELISGSAIGNRLVGGAGNDTLDGGDGNDTLVGGAGADAFIGGTGNDTVDYRGSAASITLFVGAPASSTGDAAGDTFNGVELFFLTNAAAGDTFFGGSGGDYVDSGVGNDVLFGNAGADTMDGGAGDDFLLPGDGADMIFGDTQFDAVFYGDAPAAITLNLATGVHTGFALGDDFNDIEAFLMTPFGDSVTGRDDAGAGDILYGLGGADVLIGQGGFDYLLGGDGDDTLNGGFGYDLMTGGAGADRFVFNNGFEGGAFVGGGEVITDFQVGVDRIAFVSATSGFASFTLGQNLFIQNGGVTGAQGTTTGPTLIYDRTAGALWFDSNGNQAGGLNYLASLLGTPTLTAADFIVI